MEGKKSFISDMQQIVSQLEKWLSLLSNSENKTNLIHLFVNSLKKYEKNVPIMTENIHGGLKREFLHFNC